MKLQEIITANEDPQNSILIDEILKYQKSLHEFYKRQFNQEPCLMVTSITNATCYARIVPADEISEALEEYLSLTEATEEEKEAERENILFNSRMFSQLPKMY